MLLDPAICEALEADKYLYHDERKPEIVCEAHFEDFVSQAMAHPALFDATLATELDDEIADEYTEVVDMWNNARIPLGESTLNLVGPIQLGLKLGTTDRYDVIDWGIEIEANNIHNLPQVVARRFMEHLTETIQPDRTAEKMLQGERLMRHVDVATFFAERQGERFKLFRVQGIGGARVKLVMLGGEDIYLDDPNLAQVFGGWVRNGDWCSAWLRFGPQGTVRALRDLRLAGEPEDSEPIDDEVDLGMSDEEFDRGLPDCLTDG